jgi:hypothetical protein
MGGRLPAETRSGAGCEASGEAPSGPPSKSVPADIDLRVDEIGGGNGESIDGDIGDADRDVSHVTLKVAELRRLLAPSPHRD